MAEETKPWSLSGMLADPNFQLALANMGTAADPEGTGGTIGKAAANLISSKAAQTAVEKRDKSRQTQIDMLVSALGGLTPKDQPGITSLSRTPSGGLKIDYDLPPLDTSMGPGSQTMQLATQQAKPVGTGTVLAPKETPAAIATTPATSLRATPTRAPQRQLDIADIAPFLLSPGGFEAGSLAGLNPEQVASIGRLDTEREALRLRSVQDLIKSRETQSEIDYRLSAGELNQAQAAILRQKEPHVAAQMLAEIDQSREAAGANRALRTERETLLPVKVEQERAQTRLIGAQERRVSELLQFEKNRITADINQSLAAANLSNINAQKIRDLYPKEAALLDKQNAEYVPMQIDGKAYTAKGMDLVKERNDNVQKIMELEKQRQQKIREARKDDMTMLKTSADAETNIKTLAKGAYKLQPQELKGQMDLFHATSKNPYVYVLEPDPSSWEQWTGKGDDTTYRKVRTQQLPTVNGQQYTAQDVYDAATERGMTVQQYLEQVFYPMLKQDVPWKVTSEPK